MLSRVDETRLPSHRIGVQRGQGEMLESLRTRRLGLLSVEAQQRLTTANSINPKVPGLF